MEKNNEDLLKESIRFFFSHIGDDPNREGLLDTPNRVVKAIDELFSGYKQKPEDILKTTFIDGSCNEMVILSDIDFISFCEHHLLPIVGKCHIGYIPNGKVVGISKLARIVNCFSKRLQIQEKMTCQIADSIRKYLEPKGVMVICEAVHYCMIARGVKKQNSIMKTSAIRGVFNEIKAREEFLSIINLRRN